MTFQEVIQHSLVAWDHHSHLGDLPGILASLGGPEKSSQPLCPHGAGELAGMGTL